MIKLSVLIPSYNHSQFILETLESHAEKNPFNYEIIVLDDGSTDNSVELIQGWMDRHPEIETRLVSRANKGVTATLNELIGMARGEYLRLFGSDDVTYPGANALMVAHLEGTKADAVFGYCRVIDENGVKIAENSLVQAGRSLEEYSSEMARSIITKWAVVGPSLLLRKDAFETIGKFDEASLIEDWYLYLNLVGKLKLAFIQSPVADYRHHSANASRTKDPARRIRNYESQIKSGEDCLRLFAGKELEYLKEAIYLLKLKKSFVERDIARFPFYAVRYSLARALNKL